MELTFQFLCLSGDVTQLINLKIFEIPIYLMYVDVESFVDYKFNNIFIKL